MKRSIWMFRYRIITGDHPWCKGKLPEFKNLSPEDNAADASFLLCCFRRGFPSLTHGWRRFTFYLWWLELSLSLKRQHWVAAWDTAASPHKCVTTHAGVLLYAEFKLNSTKLNLRWGSTRQEITGLLQNPKGSLPCSQKLVTGLYSEPC